MNMIERWRIDMTAHDLSPRDLCRLTGLDKGYLSRVLNGKIKPSEQTVRRIVEAIHADDFAETKGNHEHGR